MCTFITSKSAHKGGNGNNYQPAYREYMKGEKGVWASQQNVKKSNKMEASPFR